MATAPQTSDVMGYRDLVGENGTYSDPIGFQWHMMCRHTGMVSILSYQRAMNTYPLVNIQKVIQNRLCIVDFAIEDDDFP